MKRSSLRAIRTEAARCRRCPLWKLGTQTVFGEGAANGLMLVGEQPGDMEDEAGRPFVGPAGRLLRQLLDEAEISASDIYLTNAVKHFKWLVCLGRRQRRPSSVGQPGWVRFEAARGSSRTAYQLS